MDDGEVELSDHILLPNSDSSNNIQAPLSSDSFLDDFLRNSQTCTHTHTCNPPGPDSAHTHTCYHTHTHVITSDEDKVQCDEKSPVSKPRRGNREAVRKYREKKKAHVAYLEEEVKKLKFVNQQLMRKLQRQTILETEVFRLRGLLLDLRGKIDNELGDFPFRKQCNMGTSFNEGECGKTVAARESTCQPASVDCLANTIHIGNVEKCLQDSKKAVVPSAGQEE